MSFVMDDPTVRVDAGRPSLRSVTGQLRAGANSSPAPSLGSPRLADDLLWGSDAIAEEIGLSKRATLNMLEQGLLPARKRGGRWQSTKSALRRHFQIGEPAHE